VPADRIVSLVPAASEILFAIGAGDNVQAVSHACDHPPEAAQRPAASRTRLDAEGSSRAIDDEVREAVDEGEAMFEVLGEVLHHAQPDLVVTQEACDVCGITPVDVRAKLARFEPGEGPELMGLHPHTLADVLDQIRQLGEATGTAEAAQRLVGALEQRIEAVEAFASDRERPTVAVLDWIDPPMAAGHWIPGMVEAAGGDPVLLDDASPSTYVEWDDVEAADPDVLLSIPCGFDARRALAEAEAVVEPDDRLPGLPRERVLALDAGAYTSRPGPRLVDGLEQIACALHGPAARQRWPEQATRVQRLGRRA